MHAHTFSTLEKCVNILHLDITQPILLCVLIGHHKPCRQCLSVSEPRGKADIEIN